MNESTSQIPTASPVQSFDLGSFEEHTRDKEWVNICHPVSGAPTGLRILAASPDSEHYRQADRKIKNRNLAFMQKSRGKPLSMEALEAAGLDLIVAITLDWQGARWDGRELECDEANARMLYATFPFIREQVDAFVGDRANFFGA